MVTGNKKKLAAAVLAIMLVGTMAAIVIGGGWGLLGILLISFGLVLAAAWAIVTLLDA